MSDDDLREAERRFRETASIDDEARWSIARVRAGELAPARLELFAALGHPAACVATGTKVETWPDVPELSEFQERLAETIVWCVERHRTERDPRMRSEELGVVVGRPRMDVEAISEAAARASRRRRDLLVRTGWIEGLRARSLLGGGLLLFDPNESLSDVAHAPGWDTWIDWVVPPRSFTMHGYFASYLACWGPPDLFAPEEGTEWADAITDPFTELLARARLIVA
jgi:hypothetical protein